MAGVAAVVAAIDLRLRPAPLGLSNSTEAVRMPPEVQPVRWLRHVQARIHVDLMVAVRLSVAVDEVLRHWCTQGGYDDGLQQSASTETGRDRT